MTKSKPRPPKAKRLPKTATTTNSNDNHDSNNTLLDSNGNNSITSLSSSDDIPSINAHSHSHSHSYSHSLDQEASDHGDQDQIFTALDAAKEALDACDPNTARNILLQCLSLYPSSGLILEALGIVEMEADAADSTTPDIAANTFSKFESTCAEKAEMYFRKAIELDPESVGSEAYMYLGQMTFGLEAVGFYDKGVSLMQAIIEQSEDEEEVFSFWLFIIVRLVIYNWYFI